MRTMQFRAWDKKEKCWIMNTDKNPFNIIGEFTMFNLLDQYSLSKGSPKYINNIVISQFTGLNDCEGKKIFEGDFLHHNLWYRVVYVKHRGRFGMMCKHGNVNMHQNSINEYKYRIVGNEFENPELLEKIEKDGC